MMKKINIARTVAVLITAASIFSKVVGETVTVDVNTWHQKISGFGACSAWNGTLTDSVGELLWSTTKGAGLSTHRVMIEPNGLGDDETRNAIAASSYGVKVWGTPWFCKNGVRTETGYDTLYEKDYQEWADTLAATANKMKNMGVPLYAISSGNEIDLGWTKYSAEALALWVGKYMGPTLAAKAPDVKVIGIETCNGCGFDYYYNYFKDNPDDAWKYSSILATHPYGCSPGTYPEINAAGKEYWQTEISDDKSDGKEDLTMVSAINVCKMIHRDLTVASVNAWHYWNVYGNNCGGLFTGDKVASKRLWVMGNWSRFVRPGFTRVEATAEPTSDVAVTAFRDSALNRVVIVACNYNSSDISQDFSISGTSPLKMTPYITDPNRDLAELSTQTLSSNTFTYTLPAQSVTSFIVDLKDITTITPYLQIDNGTWQKSSTAALNAGQTIKFGPQPTSDGSWSWSGPNGFSASTREVTISNISSSQAGDYIATYTNTSGSKSNITFTVTICTKEDLTPYLRIDDGIWEVDSSATINAGQTIILGPQPITGGSWSWSGPNGFRDSTREITISNFSTSKAGSYVATYTESTGCTSVITFTISMSGNTSVDGPHSRFGIKKAYAIENTHQGLFLKIQGFDEKAAVTIYNLKGVSVYRNICSKNKIHVPGLNKGLYLIKIVQGNTQLNGNFMIR